jgi:hypothetical protein
MASHRTLGPRSGRSSPTRPRIDGHSKNFEFLNPQVSDPPCVELPIACSTNGAAGAADGHSKFFEGPKPQVSELTFPPLSFRSVWSRAPRTVRQGKQIGVPLTP